MSITHSLRRVSCPRNLVDAAVEVDVLLYGEVFVEGETLAHVADVFLDLFPRSRITSNPATVPVPLVGRKDAAQHADGGRFAGTVGPEKTEDLPLLDLEADLVHGDEVAELLGDVRESDGWFFSAHGVSPRRKSLSFRSSFQPMAICLSFRT